ncbi:hypothetical protein JX265_004880 [Neoarthrinium moseri]|uniref:Uncharacterized protein n=1 Tax=Neoarthrinium moseri TaxID=1658444 RepID=A0A9Q0ANG1_9PEZI|nr:uncharacterized protein JN550_003617 [Neoarthrinium moseri]KAI1846910.1 hypothetical protein JX266_007131 [Neoarthrinium moseri]KAI1872743.1 hypothetical protein JN550_003617 [Neoarthrinium moseri]KAI1874672.1 hypothetical protein JX265_004880 [Neoarthrinium moseri]
MSRNVRQKPPVTPVKKAPKRRGSDSSSSLDLSDSDGYSAVGDISDSDEDEDDVIAAEEEHLRVNGWHASNQSSPRPVNEADEEGDDEDDPNEEDDEEDDDDEDEDEEAVEDTASWEGFMSEGNDNNASDTSATQDVSVERRVRFAGVSDSEGDTTETDEGIDDEYNKFFPDIFLDQDALDPSFRREIEHDDGSSDSGSFWDLQGNHYDVDFQNMDIIPQAELFSDNQWPIHDMDAMAALMESDSTPVATPMTAQELSTAVSTPAASPEKGLDELSTDGYQSDGEDGGDTTDEDEEPARQPIRRRHSREAPAQSSASDSDIAHLVRPRRGKPRVGKFNLDSDGKKPVAVVNPRTGKLMIFTPQRLRRLDLSPETFNLPLFQPIDSSPIFSNSGNLMMGAMMSSNTLGDFLNPNQPVGPVEAFFSNNSLEDIFEDEAEDDEEDEGEHGLAIGDFLELDGSDDDQDNGPSDNDDYFTTPSRPDTAGGDVSHLLSHFEHNSDIVGAFRRDQANSQLLRSGKATRESLAFSGPLHQGTLRGIKDGRISSTNIPISPLRKQKKRMPNLASSPLASVTQKRKSSSEQQPFGHKRQRSIPDVALLDIN